MKSGNDDNRRKFLRVSAIAGAGVVLAACEKKAIISAENDSKPEEKGGEVTATEDLMREHGVLRRALLVYSAAVMKLRSNHEKKLEEAYIFPAVRKAGGEA